MSRCLVVSSSPWLGINVHINLVSSTRSIVVSSQCKICTEIYFMHEYIDVIYRMYLGGEGGKLRDVIVTMNKTKIQYGNTMTSLRFRWKISHLHR